MRLSQSEYDALLKKRKPEAAPVRTPTKRGPNKTEVAYGDYLELLRRAGEIDWYRFEAITLKLANDTRYTPDYPVRRAGMLEFHEVKGHMRDDAWVKLKVAAEQYPFRFLLVKYERGAWITREIA